MNPIPSPLPDLHGPTPRRPMTVVAVVGIIFLSGIGMTISGVRSLATPFGLLLFAFGLCSIVVARGLYNYKYRAYEVAMGLQVVLFTTDVLTLQRSTIRSPETLADIVLTLIVCVLLHLNRKRFVAS